MEIGKYHTLKVLRETSVGYFLGNEVGEDVLLPNKFVPNDLKIDDEITVFIYLDSDERITATTQTPEIIIDSFAFLEVGSVNKVGAFLNWGIDKQLFVPFQEQKSKMQEGEYHLVYMYLDEKTKRLTASSKWDKFIKKDAKETLKEQEEVSVLVLGESPLGYNCIVNNAYKGLAYFNENFKEVSTGMQTKAYIKQVREDGKIDLLFEPPGVASLEKHAETILKILRKNGGFLPYHDKSDAEEVRQNLQMSKKAYKKAIGNLYKNKFITIEKNGVKLVD
ncbi:MAG: GntR family transcriptional regulator [Bacteroidetes bacterium]|nr:GntR family transcriptional regulator [Bacteroidota bacterium]MCB9226536.1 GntR family transcriptional regulator [Chitinophagales bacterium]